MIKLVEYSAIDFHRVDEGEKTIRGVAVLGRMSRKFDDSKRRYSDTAFADAVKLFVDIPVFLDHRVTEAEPNRNHPVKDYVGKLVNPRIDGEYVRGDLKVINEDHWTFLRNVAQENPRAVGMSMEAIGATIGTDVVSIREINSVDVVAHPATTSGLFETKEIGMENLGELTLEQLKKECSGLVDEITEPFTKEITELKTAALEESKKKEAKDKAKEKKEATLEEKVTVLEKSLAESQVRQEVMEKLREAKVTCSDLQLKALLGFGEEDRKTFIEELAKIAEQLPTSVRKTNKGELTEDKVVAAFGRRRE